MEETWLDSLDATITICDFNGIITYLNNKAAGGFSKYGGYDLIGKNIFNCHSESSGKILKTMLETQRENIYTIEKAGLKTLICQKPIYEKGKFNGFIEIAFDLPSEMPHHIRD